MKTIGFTAFFFLALSIFAVSADAQRKRKPTPRATPRPTPVSNTTNAVVAAAKQRVSNQLHNVNVFVEKFGPVAVVLEDADRANAARRLSREAAAANEKNKGKIIDAIRVLRAALVKLESDFRTQPQLSLYLPRIQGISTLAADSEDSAIAGKFVAAKDPLREVALKLNDTLAVLPGPMPAGSVRATVPPRTVSTPSPTSSSSNRPVSMTSNPGVSREPIVGMTTTEVTQSAWGAPSNKRTSRTANGTTEVWTYTGKGTIYFFNGKVTQILR